MTCWTVDDEVRPRSLNAERNMHHHARAKLVAEERERWGWLWRKAGLGNAALDAIEVEARPSYKRKGNCPDAGNCYPTVKAAIDALIDVGAIADDGPDVVRRIDLVAPNPADNFDRLQLTVRRVPAVRLDLTALADALRPLAEVPLPLGRTIASHFNTEEIRAAQVALASLEFATMRSTT